jgi:hypothetical protein
MSKRRIVLIALGGLLLLVMAYLAIYADPTVNYYSVRMRNSQFHPFLAAHHPDDPDFAIYCLSLPPINLSEQSVCFDSDAELQRFMQRRHEIEQALSS